MWVAAGFPHYCTKAQKKIKSLGQYAMQSCQCNKDYTSLLKYDQQLYGVVDDKSTTVLRSRGLCWELNGNITHREQQVGDLWVVPTMQQLSLHMRGHG